MYEETGYFDPNPTAEANAENNGFSQAALAGYHQLPPPLVVAGSTTNSHNSFSDSLRLSVEELSAFHHSPQDDASAAVAAELQFPDPAAVNTHQDQIQNQHNANLIHQMIHDSSFGQSNWDTGPQNFVDIHHHIDQSQSVELQNSGYSMNPLPSFCQHPNNPPTPDLLSLLHLPRCSAPASLLASSSISFTSSSLSDIVAASCVTYDPLFHLNLPPQPPLIRDLYPPPTNACSAQAGCLLGMDNQREAKGGVIYTDGSGTQFDKGILEFTKDISHCMRKGRGSHKNKHFATERERRNHLNDRFDALKDLIPNLTKTDRASILADAIDYIKELLRRVSELKFLVEKKRCGKHRSKRQKTEECNPDNPEKKPEIDADHSLSCNNNSLRTSWLQRKSKVTEVDVRIIDDEVTIKVVQKKKINCLLLVSRVLDQLRLDLHHVAGGQIGEHYSFLFNTKIYEGSTIYASAIASTLIEVVDKQYMAALPTNSEY